MFGRTGILLAALCAAMAAPATAAGAECFDWPLREVRDRYAYDGDTVYILVPDLPAPLSEVSVRVSGIDAPEIRAQCDEERYQATAARDYLDHLLRRAEQVTFCEPSWDKYGGRVVAEVRVDGGDVADLLIAEGFARRYDGGRRDGWCSPR